MTLGLDPDSVFPRTGLQKGDNEMTITDLRAEVDKRTRQGLSPHNQIMAIQKKFSIPVACFVFALLGLGLGVTTRKDGKQSSFVIAIAIIFIYYIFMYTAESMAKAKWIPAASAMWVPNFVLGACRPRAAAVARPLRRPRVRPFPLTLALAPERPRRRQRPADGAPGAAAGDPGPARPGPHASSSSSGCRTGPGRAPRILDWYVAKLYVRIFVLAFAGMLGIFYIATFIDLSDKLFKGQATGRMLLEYPVLLDAAVHLLRAAHRGAGRHARHRGPAHEVERADRHQGVRRQPLPDGVAACRVRRARQRPAVRPGGVDPGAGQPAGPATQPQIRGGSPAPST